MRALAVLFLAVPAFADASLQAKAAAGPPRVLCSLQRTGCAGWCPVYKVTIWTDGRLEYRGYDWVASGRATTRLDMPRVQALAGAFESASFFSLRSPKGGDKEMKDVVLEYHRGNRHKRLVFRDGRPSDGPLLRLAAAVDRIVDIERFIGPETSRLEPPAPPH
jgi:hypothetical protein